MLFDALRRSNSANTRFRGNAGFGSDPDAYNRFNWMTAFCSRKCI